MLKMFSFFVFALTLTFFSPTVHATENMRMAFDECLRVNNMSLPEMGDNLSESDHELLVQCLTNYGFDKKEDQTPPAESIKVAEKVMAP